jgi:hypothetical protein
MESRKAYTGERGRIKICAAPNLANPPLDRPVEPQNGGTNGVAGPRLDAGTFCSGWHLMADLFRTVPGEVRNRTTSPSQVRGDAGRNTP